MNPYPDGIADYAEATASNFISNNLAVPITQTTVFINWYVDISDPEISQDWTASLIQLLIAADKNLQNVEVQNAE
jgi:hypothetical protein